MWWWCMWWISTAPARWGKQSSLTRRSSNKMTCVRRWKCIFKGELDPDPHEGLGSGSRWLKLSKDGFLFTNKSYQSTCYSKTLTKTIHLLFENLLLNMIVLYIKNSLFLILVSHDLVLHESVYWMPLWSESPNRAQCRFRIWFRMMTYSDPYHCFFYHSGYTGSTCKESAMIFKKSYIPGYRVLRILQFVCTVLIGKS